MSDDDALSHALARHRAGDVASAEALYRQVLAKHADDGAANEGLGVLLFQIGQLAPAIELLRRALRTDPRLVDAQRTLAYALIDAGRPAEALLELTALTRLCPGDPAAWNNLGALHAGQKRPAEAEAAFRKAIQLQPDYHAAIVNLANAIADPGREAEVAALCRDALTLRPDDDSTRFLLAAMTGDALPPSAPRGYLTSLFDTSATMFDDQAGSLSYRGPQMLRAALEAAAGPIPPHSLDIMDLGCGTGLCGVVLRDLARSLAGVDLSIRMLDRAKTKGAYTLLLPGEIVPTLNALPESFDLIVSVDVFIYVGDLEDVFAATAKSLRPGGLFAFGVESTEGTGFVLRPTRRYAHSAAYIQSLAAHTGFELLLAQSGPLRSHQGHEVEGATYVLRHPGIASQS